MRKRWKLLLAILLFLALLIGLESQRLITGWVCGEAFYKGRPTSYWRGELQRWEKYCGIILLGNGVPTPPYDWKWTRRPSLIEDLFSWFGLPESNLYLGLPLNDGDPEAEAVLTELLQDSNPLIQEIAAKGLKRIQINK